MDLSKAYDCLKNDPILLPKIQAYRLSKGSIRFCLGYLTNHTQKIKISSTFSDWANLVKGIPQCSILGPLLFKYFLSTICSFSVILLMTISFIVVV